jgi:hypothetical protein
MAFSFMVVPPRQLEGQFHLTVELLRAPTGHSPGSLMSTYSNDLINTGLAIWTNLRSCILIPLVVMLMNVWILSNTKSKTTRIVLTCLPVVGFLISVAFFTKTEIWSLFGWYAILYAAILLFLAATTLASQTKMINRSATRSANSTPKFAAAIALLFALPFCCSFGASNPILLHSVTCISPIFLALSALSVMGASTSYARFYRILLTIGLSALVFARYIYGYVYHPYFLYDSLRHQQYYANDLPNLKGIRIDQQAHEFLASIWQLLKQGGFSAGDAVVALYDLPGVVYAAGGRAPAAAWLFPNAEYRALTTMWIRRIGAQEKGKLFIITSWELSPKTRHLLQESGIDFPNSFELIGSTQMKPYKDGYGSGDCGADDHFLQGEVRIYKRKPPTPRS